MPLLQATLLNITDRLNQNIKVPSSVYNNLVIRGARNKNMVAGLIIDGNLDIRSTAVLVTNNLFPGAAG
jgi:hypothetical protein